MRDLNRRFWPYKITRRDLPEDNGVEVWLMENAGPFRDRWNAVYFHHKTDYYFRDEADALLFSLRWQS